MELRRLAIAIGLGCQHSITPWLGMSFILMVIRARALSCLVALLPLAFAITHELKSVCLMRGRTGMTFEGLRTT